jgi:hypothetical protein
VIFHSPAQKAAREASSNPRYSAGGQHPHRGHAVHLRRQRQRRGHEAKAGPATPSCPGGTQRVAPAQRAAFVTTESAAQLGAARAQDLGHIHSAGQAQHGTTAALRAALRQAERQHLSGARLVDPPGHQRLLVQPRRAIGARQRKRTALAEAKLERKHRHLDGRRVDLVAQHQIAGRQRQVVHRAGRAHAPAQAARAPQILHGGERGG